MRNITQRPHRSAQRRSASITTATEQERLFDELVGLRRSLRWRCRWMVEDPAAEVDAAVWQQIAAGLQEPVDIYWGAVTALRRVKRREFRRRGSGPVLATDDVLEGALVDSVSGVEAVVVDRVAFEQLVASLGPPPSPAARRWIAQVALGRGSTGPMSPATRAAGARWARKVREQSLEACA